MIIVMTMYLAACEPDDGSMRSPPSNEAPVSRTTSLQLDAEPFRRSLARSLGESYRITSVEMRDQNNGSVGPSRQIDVVVRFKGAGHRRWSIVYELWLSRDAAATEFKEEAVRVGEDPAASFSRGVFCSVTEQGRSSCTVLVEDAIMHVVPLLTKDQNSYPLFEHVTEVAGDAARLLRRNP